MPPQVSDGKLSAFAFHGVTLHQKGPSPQAVGDCPFCDKEKHFYVNSDSGLWDCKQCGLKGNSYSFLETYLKKHRASTKPEDFKSLGILRKGIPWTVYRDAGLAVIPGVDHDRWLIPVYKSTDGSPTLVNLCVWDGPGAKVYKTSGCKLHLYRGDVLSESPASHAVYICEGEWDTLAWESVRSKLKNPGVVVGVPGATTFPADWVERFNGREVILLYDWDDAGQNGMKRAAELLQPVVKSLKLIHWPASTADGYDLSDLISEGLHPDHDHNSEPGKNAYQRIWRQVHKMLDKPESVGVSDAGRRTAAKTKLKVSTEKSAAEETAKTEAKKRKGKPPTFPQVIKEFKKHIHLDKNMEDAIAVTFAVTLSAQALTDPLWLFLVGPPGSGKTLLLRSMEGSDNCHYESTISPHVLISGYKTEDGSDPSLIPQLTGRCLTIKDYTAVKSMPLGVQEEIYGTLRDAYDGRCSKPFGNGIRRIYEDCYFSLVAGVTHVIHGDARASLGERFLKYEFIRGEHNPETHIRAAVTGADKLVAAEVLIRSIVTEFLSQPLDLSKMPKPPAWVIDRIIALSQVIAYLRASVERIGRDIAYRPQPEVGTRLSKQLVKLGQFLCFVYGKRTIDKGIYRLMEQVAFDTAIGWNLDIIRIMMDHYPNPVTREELCDSAVIAETTMYRKLGDLIELKAILKYNSKQSKHGLGSKKVSDKLLSKPGLKKLKKLSDKDGNSTKPGQPAHGFIVAPALAKLWLAAKVDQ